MRAPESMSATFSAAVDDIFDGSLESTSQSDSGPYVINLSSSSAPEALPESGIPLTSRTRVYTTRQVDDRRVRYRLRLGPFLTESQANDALRVVRENYPAAFAAPASTEDLDEFDGMEFEAIAEAPQAKSPPAAAMSASVLKSAAVTALPQPKAAAMAVPTPAAVKVQPLREVPTLATPAVNVPKVVTVVRPPAAPSVPASSPTKAAAPAPVAPAAQLKSVAPVKPAAAIKPAVSPPKVLQAPAKIELSLAPDTAVAAPTKPAVSPPKVIEASGKTELSLVPEAIAAAPKSAAATPARASSAPPPAMPKQGVTLAHEVSGFLDSMALELVQDDKPQLGKGSPDVLPHRQAPPALRRDTEEHGVDLESTQTMRALTSAELADNNKTTHCFAIELAVSEKAFDPDAVPDLDIFSAYRLYVVKSEGPGGSLHSLRLGFFGSDLAAKAVAGYLTEHYQKAGVMRVSNAERERFSQDRVEARKRVEATGKHAVIEITDQRYIRELSLIDR